MLTKTELWRVGVLASLCVVVKYVVVVLNAVVVPREAGALVPTSQTVVVLNEETNEVTNAVFTFDKYVVL